MNPSTRRGLHSGARLAVLAAAAAGLFVGVPALTWSADLAPNHRDRIPLERTPLTAATLLCPGPELVGLPGSVDVTGAGSVAAAAPPITGTVTGAEVTVGATSLPALGRGTVLRADLAGAAPVIASATQAAAQGLVAGQAWAAATADFRGMVAASCGRPSADFWLVGGGGEPGRQERIVLANPGANEVVVDLVVHGAKGIVESPSGRGVVVPARGRAAVLLDALAPSEPAPAIHVRATGGSVRGVLNDTWVDGTVAAGSASSGPIEAPAQRQVIPLLRLPARDGGAAGLRVAVPGDRSAVVTVRAITKDGPRPLAGGVRTVAAGSTADFDLMSLAAQNVALEVSADVPVVAAARSMVRAPGRPADFAWSPAQPAISGLAGVALPELDGSATVLGLAATGGAARVEVIQIGTDGSSTSTAYDLSADRSQLVSLATAQAVWVRPVSGSGEVRATAWSAMTGSTGLLFDALPLEASPIDAETRRIVPLP